MTRPRPKAYLVKTCDVCGKKYKPSSGAQKYCGKACRTVRVNANERARRKSPEYRAKCKAYKQIPERRIAQKKYRQTPKRQAIMRAYRQDPEYKTMMRRYRQDPEYKAAQKKQQTTPEAVAARRKRRATPRYREQCRQYAAHRYKTDPRYKLNDCMSSGIYKSLKGNKQGRSWSKLVDYTLNDLRKHLEAQFTVGMAWSNHGKWHIDHIRPKSSFTFTSSDDEEFKQCWALSNLQPLWAKDNRSKGAKYDATAAQAA